MKINPLEMYKLIEADRCLILCPMSTVNLPFKHVELVAGDANHVAEYMQHYLHARSVGRRIKQAHAEALIGARVVGPNGLDAVTDEMLKIEQ